MYCICSNKSLDWPGSSFEVSEIPSNVSTHKSKTWQRLRFWGHFPLGSMQSGYETVLELTGKQV
jgi:hypothetical protein